MSFLLTPVGLGAEYLREVRLNCANVEEESFHLGRNDLTGLNSPNCPNFQYISRKHVELRIRGKKLYMLNIASQDNVVTLNGNTCPRVEIELHDFDVVCLLGVKKFYNYEVKYFSEPPAASGHATGAPIVVDLLNSAEKNRQDRDSSSPRQARALQPSARTQSIGNINTTINLNDDSVELLSAPTRSPSLFPSQGNGQVKSPNQSQGKGNAAVTTSTITAAGMASPSTLIKQQSDVVMKSVVKKLLRQYECSICMDTLAGAVSLSPCGCCFCYTCVAEWVTDHHARKATKTAALLPPPPAPLPRSSSSSSIHNGSSAGSLSDLQYTAPCPNCNADFVLTHALPNRVLDNATREILLHLPEELKEWEERVTASMDRRKQVMDTANSNNSNKVAASGASASAVNGANSAAATSAGMAGIPRTVVRNNASFGRAAPGVSTTGMPSFEHAAAAAAAGAGARTTIRQGSSLSLNVRFLERLGRERMRGLYDEGMTWPQANPLAAPEVVDLQDSQPQQRFGFGFGFPGIGEEDRDGRAGAGPAAGSTKRAPPSSSSTSNATTGTTASKRARGTTSSSTTAPTYDLTSQPAYPAPAPHLRRGGTGWGELNPGVIAGPPQHHYCVMSVPSLRSEKCAECQQYLTGSKVAVGVVARDNFRPSAELAAIMNGFADTTQWRSACTTWYHLTCVKRQPGHTGLRTDRFQLLTYLTAQEKESVRGDGVLKVLVQRNIHQGH